MYNKHGPSGKRDRDSQTPGLPSRWTNHRNGHQRDPSQDHFFINLGVSKVMATVATGVRRHHTRTKRGAEVEHGQREKERGLEQFGKTNIAERTA